MPDQLTSVRFDQELLNGLRLLADLHDTNVAAEVREAVKRYIREVTSAADFDDRLAEADRARRRLVDQVLASGTGR